MRHYTSSLGRGRTTALLAILLAAVTIGAYYPALTGGFIWDDDQYVRDNATLRTGWGLWDIWFDPHATPQYYPLVHTTFWIECRLWGLAPLGYHLSNVALHVVNALLFWAVLRRLGLRGGYAAALLFAVHPVMVESAGWITERKNVLSLAFCLGALWCYLRFQPLGPGGSADASAGARPWRAYGLALALFLCALLSKTVTCTLPAVILLLVWWRLGRVRWRQVWPLLPMIALGGLMGGITAWLERTHVGAEGIEWNLSWLGRLLLAGRIPWFYLGKLLWPAETVFFYPAWSIDPSQAWQYAYPAAAVGLVAALWLLRRRIGRGPLAAVLCFGVALAPALGFLNVYPMRYSYVADHFQYHASLAIFALVAAGGAALAGRWKPYGPPAAGAGLAAAAAVLACLTYRQSGDYRDLRTLWANTIRKNPACWAAVNNLACLRFAETTDPDVLRREVAPLFEESLRLYAAAHAGRANENALANLGVICLMTGQFENAHEYFQKALAVKPDSAAARVKLGMTLLDFGRPLEALPYFEGAVVLDPRCADAWRGLGGVRESQGLRAEAIACYEKAVAAAPEDTKSHLRLGILLLPQNQKRALVEFRQALELDADPAREMDGIALALFLRDEPSAALQMAKGALAADGNLPRSLGIAAMVLSSHPDPRFRDGRLAVELATRLCRNTGYADAAALDALACAYAEIGDFPQARQAEQKAADLAARSGSPATADSAKAHLRLFEANHPYRRPAGQ